MTRIKFAALIVLLAARLFAQSDSSADPGKAAQAKSQEEFDLYLEIVTATEPQLVIGRVEEFVGHFPQSELLPPAYQTEMHAFEQLNDFSGMLAAGRQALAGNPDNVNVLLALAPAMASRAAGRADKDELLSQAEGYARSALAQIDAMRVSRKISMEQWNLRKRQMQSEAHGVLGTVALQRKQSKAAVEEFETALNLSPKPQGIDYLRLGLALGASGATSDAQKNLRRAAELGPEAVSALAREQIK